MGLFSGMRLAGKTAVAAGRYDAFLWLNDDVCLFSGAIGKIAAYSSCMQNTAIIVGATCNQDGRMTYGGRDWTGLIHPEEKDKRVLFFNGNIVLVPWAVYERLGNLDPYFSHAFGDFDYGMRATEAGIDIYQCDTYLGLCNNNEGESKWADKKYPFRVRWRAMKSCGGMPPNEVFYFEKRHFGFFKAAFHWFTVIFRCAFPGIWR